MATRAQLILLFCLLFSSLSQATGYPAALNNFNLKEEIQDQEDRMIPKTIEWFSAAVDGQTYARTLERHDFYHSIGYWVQARSEFRLKEHFRLNVRSIFYSGSVSGGYAEPTGTYHLFSLTGLWPDEILGGRFDGRAVDLGRQTIGEGLMMEEKEMAGLLLSWSRNGHSIRTIWNGTGGYFLDDDMLSPEFKLFNGLIGGGAIFWTAGRQSGLEGNRQPYYFISSTLELAEGFSYMLEGGSRETRYASLVGLRWQRQFSRLRIHSRLQARHYDDMVANELVGQMQQVYVSYDQYDKRFTNAANVFVYDDDVNVYSLILDFDYRFNDKWEFSSRNEVGRMDFRMLPKDDFLYYRVGLTYSPIEGRNESITVFQSNKVLADSYSRPPTDVSDANLPLFKQVNFFGIEGAFRF